MNLFPFLFLYVSINAMILVDHEQSKRNSNLLFKESSKASIASWAEAAYDWIRRLNCSDQDCLCEESCSLIKSISKSDFRIYATEMVQDNKYGMIFPDSDTKHKTFHDAVVVMDPFPAARFGHPILVFNVDRSSKNGYCDSVRGFLTNDATVCLQPINRSFNSKLSYGYLSRFLTMTSPNCAEVLFLPLVHLQTELPVQINDKLTCVANIDGFNQSCPHLRPKLQTNNISCDPILTNQYRDCLVLENSLGSRCSTSQTCDHAILLSGGWNRQLSDVSTYNNVLNMKNLLIAHRFLESNIEMFYANGKEANPDEESESYYSASMKSSMRSHIRTLCDFEFCSDTLFIYMNSPARPDGSSLLWDTFDNGIYDNMEIYSTRELMRDIAHCTANRVVIMADQSYGASLVAAAEARFTSLQNVVIFTSADEFNYNTTIKDRLTKQLIRAQHNDICLNDFKNMFYKIHKAAVYVGMKPNLLNSTLVGAPCTSKSTSLNDPETFKYRGCSLSPLI